ncbi:hypothetical protein ANCCAN_00719 [Ancylostoma caninum]|uniref:C2H2-type domain-containing protein n=1 Tax=Ancylostoma caninum TaxID=29170 RepID=A0A368HD64_ANCCA|nr:hypothetical protein ANCCAN_00719 [Ancylostoma caninum]
MNRDTIIKEEEPISHMPSSSKHLGFFSMTPADEYGEDLGGETIFEDCVQDNEQNASIHGNPATDLFSNEALVSRKQGKASLSTTNRDETSRDDELTDTAQAQPERSFIEFSRKVMNGILGVNRNRREHSLETTAEMTTENIVFSQDDSKEDLEIMTESDTSYLLADLTSNEAGCLRGEELLDNDENVTEQCDLSSATSSSRRRRKRTRPSSSGYQNSDGDGVEREGESATESSKRRSSLPSGKEPERVFECKYPGCTAKMSWRPRYGKNRLVDHVRVHWGKQVKQCGYCGYVATHQRKVHTHHRRFHSGMDFTGAISLETKEDMDELVELWKQCFPGASVGEFSDPCLSRTPQAKPALLFSVDQKICT